MSETASCPVPWSAELRTLGLRHGDRVAVRDAQGSLSYQALSGQAHGLAAFLGRRLPPEPRVAVLLRNSRLAVVADYGIACAGGCIVHLNPAYSREELAHCRRLTSIDMVLTEPALATEAEFLGAPVVSLPLDGLPDEPPAEALPPARAAAPARILFTSGTSGPPKAVVLSHDKRWMAAAQLRAALPYRPARSGLLLMTPYVHGASMLARAYLDYGGWVWLQDGVRPQPVQAALDDGGIEAMFAPPSVLAKLVDALADRPPHPLRCIFSGTQPLPPSLYRRARARFGPCLRVTYGKSENFNPVATLEADECEALYDGLADDTPGCCVGYPWHGVEIRLDADGEVLLRSRHMFDGYLTVEGPDPHPPDGWHRTGDLGRWDAQGRLWLTGRTGNIINTGGYKINPEESAALIRAVPGVSEALVVGVASDYWTQIPVCGYVAAPGIGVVADDLARAVAGLTRYKQPRLYVALDAMPLNAVGKPSPQGLRDEISSRYVLHDGPHPRWAERS